jgi:hypothetical protein
MNPGESYADYMRRVEAELRERIAEANTFPRGSKERRARLGTARTLLVGVLRMNDVDPQDEARLRAMIEDEQD